MEDILEIDSMMGLLYIKASWVEICGDTSTSSSRPFVSAMVRVKIEDDVKRRKICTYCRIAVLPYCRISRFRRAKTGPPLRRLLES